MKDKEIEIVDLSVELEKSKPYLDKFTKAKTFNNSRQDAYAENMAFYQGNQHLLAKYKNDNPWVVNMNTPYATVAIDNRVSSLLSKDYIGELLPISADDVEAVDSLDKVYKREWKRMNIDEVVRSCIKGAAVVREYYCHIITDTKDYIGNGNTKTQGRMEAYAIEPSCIYIDPNARNLRDARYMFVLGRMSKEEAIEKYKKIKMLKNQGSEFTPQDRGEVYNDNDYTTEQEDVFTVMTYYGKENGKIRKVKLVNGIIVSDKLQNRKNIPVLQFRWEKAAQSCYGLSLMDRVLCLQKAITSIESAITNTAMSYAAPSMMVRNGCGVDPKVVSKANGAPGVVYAVDGNLDNAIKPVIPPKIQQDILNIKTDFQNQIDKITGNSNQFLGDIGTAGNTSGGANIAVERAKIIEIGVLNNIEEFIRDITDVIVENISIMYENEEVTYNDGKDANGNFKFETIKIPKKDVLKSTKYQYHVELETKTPYSREKQKQLLLEIYQMERQYDTAVKTITISDVIKNMDLENKEEIIARFNSLSFQDSMTKVDTIDKLMATGRENGISEDLLKQAAAEIVDSRRETPAVDEVMKQLEQVFKQTVEENQRKLDNASSMLMATPQAQQEVQNMANNIEQEGMV